jgi:hypothetical protein
MYHFSLLQLQCAIFNVVAPKIANKIRHTQNGVFCGEVCEKEVQKNYYFYI